MNKGTIEGTEEEILYVKAVNKKEETAIWKLLSLDSNSCYAIHVIENKYGQINKSKVKPKADVFIAKGYVPKNYLEEKDYYLNELDILTFELIPIKSSGISVKRKDSLKYQIMKMNPSTFNKIFNSYNLGAGASIYCRNPIELIKNTSVLTGWHTDWNSFVQYFKNINNIAYINDSKIDINQRLDIAQEVKTFSNNSINNQIINDKMISDFIFQGIGNFEEPYTASWFYELGTLKKAGLIPFSVTTGSGRSNGDFTIVLKPKK